MKDEGAEVKNSSIFRITEGKSLPLIKKDMA